MVLRICAKYAVSAIANRSDSRAERACSLEPHRGNPLSVTAHQAANTSFLRVLAALLFRILEAPFFFLRQPIDVVLTKFDLLRTFLSNLDRQLRPLQHIQPFCIGLSGALVSDGDVFKFAWAPHGGSVAYLADQTSNTFIDLYVSNATSSSNTQVSLGLNGEEVVDFAWSDDNQRLAFSRGPDDDNANKLYVSIIQIEWYPIVTF